MHSRACYHYDSGGGELDHQEFIQGIRGSEFVMTARSYGFETPDPGYFVESGDGGLGHYVDVTGIERETVQIANTPRSAKVMCSLPVRCQKHRVHSVL